MSIQRINQNTNVLDQPFASAGTYTLDRALPAGLYRIRTDTTQSLTAAQLYFQSADGYRFGAVIRGGQGYVSIPLELSTIVFTTGTFPLLLSMELIPTYNLMEAPATAAASVTYFPGGSASLTTPQMNLAYTAPAGATSVGIFWRNGTFTDFSSTTSPAASVTLAGSPTAGPYAFLVAARDAKGVWGLGTEISKPWPFTVFNASGTFTRPAGTTTANVLVVGGGGGGGGSDNSRTRMCCGGGGGGDVNYQTAVSVAASVAVTVGAAGTGTQRVGNAGGQSVFAAITANGGSGGIGYAVHQGGSLANGGAGGAAGRTGGNGVSDTGGGGGGGDGGNGGNAVTTTGGAGGIGYSALYESYAFGAGGAGSGEVTNGATASGGGAAGATTVSAGGNAPNYGGGGGGARFYGAAGGGLGGGNGRVGCVIVESIF